ncbi:MAG: ABC transporter permease [Pseudomonadales bacterium]
MSQFERSPIALWRSVSNNRSLTFALAKREIQRSYKGSVLGWFWLVAQPLALLSVYAFVFGVVLQARFGTGSDSTIDYSLNLFAGLIVFHVFSECLTRGPGLIVGNVNYVKKIVFPLEVLAIVVVAAATFRAVASFLVWLAFYGLVHGAPSMTVLLVPFAMIPLLGFSLGAAWLLSALGVYIRDLSQIVGIVATATLFLSAIFYPVSMIPEPYRKYLYLNPITGIVEQVRMLAMVGQVPAVDDFLILVAASLVFLGFSFWWFQSLRRGFSDVL